MVGTILIFIAVLAILVLVHEWGHFYTARKFDCDVEEFGIGFPPRATSWISKKTGIRYSLNWLPLGGFVKIKGEDGQDKSDPGSFAAKPAWQRAIILVAGVAMNWLLAAVLLTIGFMIGLPSGLPADSAGLSPYARVSERQVQIYSVVPQSVAAEAGVQTGDIIQLIDGQPYTDVDNVQEFIVDSKNESMDLTLLRGDEQLRITVTPLLNEDLGRATLGVGLVSVGTVSYPWFAAPVAGVQATAQLTGTIVVAFADLISDLVTGQSADVDVSGPVGIAVLTGQVARLGITHLLQFVALLSINLAIINILPLPALDGGRLLFLGIEAIRRKPADQKFESIVHNIGFLLLLLLIVFVTYRDIVRWGGGLIERIIG